MKKVLSIVLSLAMVLGSFGMAFADTTTDKPAAKAISGTPADVEGTPYEDAVTVLSALGVVSGYEDGSYQPTKVVTRAEMAKLIVAELGLEANATGSKSTFTDMAGYGWADGYVGYAQSLGIVSGYGDGTFKPGKEVSYDEALTMIVSALGYTKDAKEMNGSWPAVYVQKARVLGITDDVTAGGSVGATRGDIAIYLYNTLTCDMGYADADGAFVTKKDKDGVTVKMASNLSVEESSSYQVISKSDADNALVNIKQYVGAYAKVFTMTKGTHEDDIIAVSDVKSNFITGEYKIDDKILKAADGTEYKLDDVWTNTMGTSTELKSKGATGAAVNTFKNGESTALADVKVLANSTQLVTTSGDPANGTVVTMAVDLSGKTVKGIYSVMIWVADDDNTVDSGDLKDIKDDHSLFGKDFVMDDNDEDIDLTSFELVGVKSLSDIKAGDVVYVYTDDNDDISRVAVGTEVVSGEVTKIKGSSPSTKVTINGKEYQFASEKLANNGVGADFSVSDLDTGDEVKVLLDAYGYMYDYDTVSGKADDYAIVLDYGTKGGTMNDNNNQIKLMLADGSTKTFDVDDDLFKASDAVPGVTSTAGWEVTSGAIVKYGVNKSGVLDTFENLNNGNYKTPRTLTPDNTVESDITAKGYYDGKEIANNAVIYSFDYTTTQAINGVAPDSGYDLRSDDDNYSTATLQSVLDTDKVVATYVTDKNKISAILLFDYSTTNNTYGVVTDRSKTSGDSDYSISIMNGDGNKTYGAEKKAYNYVADNDGDSANNTGVYMGDKVYKLEFNGSGEIKNLVPLWDDKDTKNTAYIQVSSTGSIEYKNREFTITSTTGINVVTPGQGVVASHTNPNALTAAVNSSVTLDKDAVVYYNDGGDFKKGNLNRLSNLSSGAQVWFYDTEDDNNTLFDTVVIYE